MDQNYKKNYCFGLFLDEIDKVELREIFILAKAKKKEFIKNKLDDLLKVIDEVSRLWMNDDQKIDFVFDNLKNIGFSKGMIKLAINELCRIFSYDNMVRRINKEFGDIRMLDQWIGQDIKLRAYPIGLLTHITPGNVFVSSIDSLLCGVLTKNINIIKTSSKVGNFWGLIWVETLKEVEKKLGMEGIISDNIAIISYKDDIIDFLNQYNDGVVVWGNYDTIKFFSSNFDPKKKLILYGPKYSICVLDSQTVEEVIDDQNFFKTLSWDVCLWEQRACSSVQTVFIVGEIQKSLLEKFAENLSVAIRNFEIEQGELSFDEYTELFKFEEISMANEALNEGKYFERVFLDYSPGFFIGPLNRFVCVKNVYTLEMLKESLKDYSEILQSCSIRTKNTDEFIDVLSSIGIYRFVEIGSIGFSEIEAPHEGEFILRKFSKLISRYKV